MTQTQISAAAARPLHPSLDGRTFSAFLFDMDGTILTSVVAAERAWGAWATRHGLDVPAFLKTIHGVRASETIRAQNIPGIDLAAEVAAIEALEMADLDGVSAIDGASSFLGGLPGGRWAIVTSATRALFERRIAAAGLVPPAVVVTGDDVANGKPAPDCFLLGAERLGVKPEECLVFEDAPAGVAAAEAAGMAVVVVRGANPHPFDSPHHAILSYDELAVELAAGGLSLRGR
jgi:mannitol-1-/sugar-/sorbitol-6-phosphatase